MNRIQSIADGIVRHDREQRLKRNDYQRVVVWMSVLIGCCGVWALLIGLTLWVIG